MNIFLLYSHLRITSWNTKKAAVYIGSKGHPPEHTMVHMITSLLTYLYGLKVLMQLLYNLHFLIAISFLTKYNISCYTFMSLLGRGERYQVFYLT